MPRRPARLALLLLQAVLISVLASCKPSTPLVFPDPAMEEAIRSAISRPTGDVHASDLADLTSLDISSRDIVDLTGIEHCTGLTVLDISGNSIVDLGPLEGLATLQRLYAKGNSTSDLNPVAGLTNLSTELNLSGNISLTDIDALAGLVNLEALDLPGCRVVDITPLMTNHNSGGLQSGSRVDITSNNMVLTAGSDNRAIVDALILVGVEVEYEEGNTI